MDFTGLSLLNWLLIAWGFVTTILVLLMIYRGMISMHQEEQVFLTGGSRSFEEEDAAATARIAKLRPYVLTATGISALLAVAVAALWLERF